MELLTVIEKLREARRAAEDLKEEVLLYMIDMAIYEAIEQNGQQVAVRLGLLPAHGNAISH